MTIDELKKLADTQISILSYRLDDPDGLCELLQSNEFDKWITTTNENLDNIFEFLIDNMSLAPGSDDKHSKIIEGIMVKYHNIFTGIASNQMKKWKDQEKEEKRLNKKATEKHIRKNKLISLETGKSVETLTAIYPLSMQISDKIHEILSKNTMRMKKFYRFEDKYMSLALKKKKEFNGKEIFTLTLHGTFEVGSKVTINKEIPIDGNYELLDFFETKEGEKEIQIKTPHAWKTITLKDGFIIKIKKTKKLVKYPINQEIILNTI